MSVTIVAMVNHTAVSRLSEEESDSCSNLKIDKIEEEIFHVAEQVSSLSISKQL